MLMPCTRFSFFSFVLLVSTYNLPIIIISLGGIIEQTSDQHTEMLTAKVIRCIWFLFLSCFFQGAVLFFRQCCVISAQSLYGC
jgi:hypothetical protein